jgi:hypothetical protein
MPHPWIDLELGLTIASNQLNEFESKGYDEKTLDKLRQWYETCQELVDAENAKKAALQGPPPGAPPMGAPPPGPPTNGAPPPMAA